MTEKKGFLTRQFGKAKRAVKKDLARRRDLRTTETKALQEARLKETTRFASKKAAQETKQRLAVRKSGPSSTGFGKFTNALVGPPQKGKKSKRNNISDFI